MVRRWRGNYCCFAFPGFLLAQGLQTSRSSLNCPCVILAMLFCEKHVKQICLGTSKDLPKFIQIVNQVTDMLAKDPAHGFYFWGVWAFGDFSYQVGFSRLKQFRVHPEILRVTILFQSSATWAPQVPVNTQLRVKKTSQPKCHPQKATWLVKNLSKLLKPLNPPQKQKKKNYTKAVLTQKAPHPCKEFMFKKASRG